MSLRERGAAWLADQRAQHLSLAVLYYREDSNAALSAMPGRTEFEQVDEYGVVHKLESRDFIVRVADLPFGLPLAGDRIEEPHGSGTITYEVLPYGDQPVWRYTDVHRHSVRIHTKRVGTVAAG